MDEYNRVRLIVEKAEYAKEGVHKGMEGIILGPNATAIGSFISMEKYSKMLTEFIEQLR